MKTLLRSFAGGEITPELYGRIDLTKYQTGLALCKNFLSLPHGPLYRRPGLAFLAEASTPANASLRAVRLIPFAFSATQTAVLEFSHGKIRVFVDGGLLSDEQRTITDIDPVSGVVSVNASTFWTDGEELFIGGRQLRIRQSLSGTTFTVEDFGGTQLFLSEALEGTAVLRVFYIMSPYMSGDLADVQFAQDNDTLTLCHPSFPMYELRRLSTFNWQLQTVSFTPSVVIPTNVSVTATVASSGNQTPCVYVVTSLDDDGVSESLPSPSVQVNNNLSAAGNFNTIRHDFMPGISRYRVYKRRGGIYGFIGTTTTAEGVAVASAIWSASVVTINTAVPHGLATGDEVLVSGFAPAGINGRATITVTDADTFTFSRTGSTAVTVLGSYLWYRPVVDDNVLADTTVVPPDDTITLNGVAGDYPSTVTYYEQRRWFAATDNEPQTVWATRNGTQSNLTSSFPARDDDGLKFRIAAQQQNRIRHLVPLGDVIAFTTGGEFRVYADNAPAITPTSLSVKPQGYNGASKVKPVATSGSILYVQAQGARVRELAYNWQNSAYSSIDISLLAPHLFDGFTIVEMAYTRAPVPTLWAVRSDGILLGMTYVPDQQVYGWHQHTTDGAFESICVIAEGLEDVLYTTVRRNVNGRTVRYVERLDARYFAQQADAFFVDSGLTYDGAPVATFSNLWHLEGKTVQILADGAVAPEKVVTGGAVTLDTPAAKVSIGLKYESDAQTLPLTFEANAGGQYAQKNVNAVAIRVARSALVKAGPSFDKLVEYPAREVSDPYGSPPQLQTGQLRMAVPPSWNPDGALCLRQDQPLPLTVLSIALDVAGGG